VRGCGYALSRRKSWAPSTDLSTVLGLATEAARASIRHGLEEAGFDRILSIADTVTEASRGVLEKAGMRFEKHAIYEDRKETRYEISRKEFQPDDAPYTLRRA